MRGFVIFLLVIGAAFWAGKTYMKSHGSGGLSLDSLISESPTKAAEARVKQILDNLEKGGDGNDLDRDWGDVCFRSIFFGAVNPG